MNATPIAPIHFTASEREREIALLSNIVQLSASPIKRAVAMDRLRQLGVGVPTSVDDPEPEAA